jgi:CBS domain-containing protein
MMTVGDLCTREVVVTHVGETVIDAAKRMRMLHVGALVVVEQKGGKRHPIGILTDRDLVLSVVASDPEHLPSLLVSDVMSSELVTVRENEPLTVAVERMQTHGIRRLPVVDAAGELVGVIAADDVLRVLSDQIGALVKMTQSELVHERHYRL